MSARWIAARFRRQLMKPSARLFNSFDHILRIAAGRNRERDVAFAPNGLNLTRKNKIEGAVVADRRQQRCIGGERQRWQGFALAAHLKRQFGGDVLRVGGRASVPENQQFPARPQGVDDHLRGARDGSWVRIAGAVIVRQRLGTAKGFLFITLEDETGTSNAIVVPDMFQKNRAVVQTAGILLIEGPVQNQDGVIHVRARRFERLDAHSMAELLPRSHDFR